MLVLNSVACLGIYRACLGIYSVCLSIYRVCLGIYRMALTKGVQANQTHFISSTLFLRFREQRTEEGICA
jgi:hypothetical protein